MDDSESCDHIELIEVAWNVVFVEIDRMKKALVDRIFAWAKRIRMTHAGLAGRCDGSQPNSSVSFSSGELVGKVLSN